MIYKKSYHIWNIIKLSHFADGIISHHSSETGLIILQLCV